MKKSLIALVLLTLFSCSPRINCDTDAYTVLYAKVEKKDYSFIRLQNYRTKDKFYVFFCGEVEVGQTLYNLNQCYDSN